MLSFPLQLTTIVQTHVFYSSPKFHMISLHYLYPKRNVTGSIHSFIQWTRSACLAPPCLQLLLSTVAGLGQT